MRMTANLQSQVGKDKGLGQECRKLEEAAQRDLGVMRDAVIRVMRVTDPREEQGHDTGQLQHLHRQSPALTFCKHPKVDSESSERIHSRALDRQPPRFTHFIGMCRTVLMHELTPGARVTNTGRSKLEQRIHQSIIV